MASRLLLPPQILGADGRPVSGAKLNTYQTGTSTAKSVFTDAALTIAHANPVVADANGRFAAMFMAGGDYRVVLTDASDVTIATYDPIEGATATLSTSAAGMRNRLLNPAMMVSQQNSTTVVALTNGAGYVTDGWVGVLSSTPGGTLWLGQVASATPGGSPNRLRCTVNATDASIAAGDYYRVEQRIEGPHVSDMRFGTSSARQILVKLGVLSSVAGTFGVSVTNSAGNRSWVGAISIGAGEVNVSVSRTLTIPGDTAGTWLTGAGQIGAVLRVCLSGGTTFQGAAGWQAGDYITTSSQTNLMATGSATFEIYDAGLYIDALGEGNFPSWEVPDFADELARCQRYWEASYDHGVAPATASYVSAATGPTQSGSANTAVIDVRYRVQKHPGTVTVTTYNPNDGTVDEMRDGGGTDSTVTLSNEGKSGFSATNDGVLAANSTASMHWVASARL